VETIEKKAQSLRGAHLWLVLWKAFDALQVHALENIHSLGLGLSDFGTLEVLLHKGPTPVNAIGQKIRLTSGIGDHIAIAVGKEGPGRAQGRSPGPPRADRSPDGKDAS
jgi:hypothetical protein